MLDPSSGIARLEARIDKLEARLDMRLGYECQYCHRVVPHEVGLYHHDCEDPDPAADRLAKGSKK